MYNGRGGGWRGERAGGGEDVNIHTWKYWTTLAAQ